MSHQAAVDALGKMSRVFKAFEDADVALKALTSLEQHEKELHKAVDSVKADKEKADTELAKVKEAVKKAKADAAKVDADAAERAQHQIDALAEKIAKSEADAEGLLRVLGEKADAVKKETAAAEAARDAANKELASVTAKLETTRSQIAKMLG